ncbi:hypothetical protein AVEN_109814-1 [Araneus ventricosus]|uniref:Uncharacterized protein n=1 Tax=Araneus ventricosus TaxID=182803 RepID=A0A4Y2GF07_ARAVE|nr:hypothetical protein AVEN_109814-1 [Araneus ventricosus]
MGSSGPVNKTKLEFDVYGSVASTGERCPVAPVNMGLKKLEFCLWIDCEHRRRCPVTPVNRMQALNFDVYGSVASTGEGVQWLPSTGQKTWYDVYGSVASTGEGVQ